MKALFAALALLILLPYHAQNLDWAYTAGQQASAQGKNIETDRDGNVYVFGSFGGTVDFDPGPGVDTLGYGSSFVTKSDSAGNLIWARMLYGSASAEALAVDPWGNVYLTGTLFWFTDFDPSPTSSYTMFPEGSSDPYICKLDASGNFRWVKRWTGGTYDFGSDIECDPYGNVYATGYFGGTFDADPGPGVFNLNNIYFDHFYLIKLDSACNLVFATSVHANDEMYSPRLELDNAGNMYLSGSWRDALWVPGFSQVNSLFYSFDIFVVKFNPFGTAQWIRRIGGGSNEYLHSSRVDHAGNIYSAGTNIGGVTDMDPGTGTYTVGTSNTLDIIISKLNSSGNFVWGVHLPEPTGHETANAIDADDNGVYLAGGFTHTIDFNPSSGTYTVAAPLYEPDAFLLKLDTGGAFQWVHTYGGTTDDVSQSVDLHPSGSIHHSGYFEGIVDLDHGVGTQTVNSGTGEDMFVRKLYGPCNAPAAPVLLSSLNGHSVCSGNSATLTASSSGEVRWFTSATGGSAIASGYQFVTPSLSANITYYAEATTCTNSISRTAITVSVTTQSLPSVTPVLSNDTICLGSTVSFSASGVYSYTWFPYLHTNTITPSATAVYTVMGTNTLGCTDTKTVQVTVLSIPQVSAAISPTSSCNGQTVSLLASGSAQSYTWAGLNVSGSTAVSYYSSTYTLTGTGINGCTNSHTVNLDVQQAPAIDIMVSSYSVCPGQTVSAFGYAMTVATYTWSHGLSQQTPFVPTVSTVYTVTGTSTLGCSSTKTMGIHVYALPTVTALISPSTICAGGSITLTSSGTANSYTWTGPSITGNVAYPSATSVYFLTGKGAGNCLVTDQVTVTVNPSPTVQVTPATTMVCQGEPVTFNATGNGHSYQWTGNISNNSPFTPAVSGTYSVTVTNTTTGCQAIAQAYAGVNSLPQVGSSAGNIAVCAGGTIQLSGTGASTYSWSHGVNNGISFTPSLSAVFTVTGTAVNGCKGTHSVQVTVHDLPQVALLTPSLLVCYGDTVQLTATGASSYNWTGGPASASWAFPATGSNTYTVTGTDSNNCIAQAVASVTVLTLPTLTIQHSGPVCEGSTLSLTAFGATTYTWSNNLTGGSVSIPAQSGALFSVTGTDNNGCKGSATVQPSVLINPTISASASPTVVCLGESTTLSATGGIKYQWSTSDTTALFIISPTADAQYFITGTGSNGCSAMDSVFVAVSLCAGTTELSAGMISLFPNPNRGVFAVAVNMDHATAIIANVVGQEIRQQKLSNGENTVNLSNEANGMYLVTVHTATGAKKIFKIIKE